MATIGDWEVVIKDQREVSSQPGNPDAEMWKFTDYEFRHVPTESVFRRIITQYKPATETQVREYLTYLTNQMKQAFIDRVPTPL